MTKESRATFCSTLRTRTLTDGINTTQNVITHNLPHFIQFQSISTISSCSKDLKQLSQYPSTAVCFPCEPESSPFPTAKSSQFLRFPSANVSLWQSARQHFYMYSLTQTQFVRFHPFLLAHHNNQIALTPLTTRYRGDTTDDFAFNSSTFRSLCSS
ncbi:unnamed protein product [Albugo candida]|uniref:Uncharacterized protein n=1 Tax=Albugo candida TaxID=65357 RepID=A0A024GMW4_9STRA|nr:unnamed protein product [Albugo candida]|eukprot:CCI48054.1 unnamed protein product [Albugo candida]